MGKISWISCWKASFVIYRRSCIFMSWIGLAMAPPWLICTWIWLSCLWCHCMLRGWIIFATASCLLSIFKKGDLVSQCHSSYFGLKRYCSSLFWKVSRANGPIACCVIALLNYVISCLRCMNWFSHGSSHWRICTWIWVVANLVIVCSAIACFAVDYLRQLLSISYLPNQAKQRQ